MDYHYNKRLEYLLSNCPEDVLSKYGVVLRKLFHPIYRRLISLSTKNKWVIEKKAIVPRGNKVIFAGTHGFRDDIALTIKTIGTHAYLLYGSIPDFYYSMDGYALWLNGTIIVDRKDKMSRAAVKPKMERAIDLGSHNLMYPEGVWNKSPNLLVLKLYPGIYDVASKKGIMVLPVATILEEQVAYSKAGEAYDMTKLDCFDYIDIFHRMREAILKMIDLMIYKDQDIFQLKYELEKLLKSFPVRSLDFYDQKTLEIRSHFYQNQLRNLYQIYAQKLSVEDNFSQEYMYDIESIISIRKRVLSLLKEVSFIERKVSLEKLRDKMASLKMELMEEHSYAKRSDFSNYQPISDYWRQYVEELIQTANGLYDYEIEDRAEFVDCNETSMEEAFEPITRIKKNIASKSKKLVLITKK